MLFRVLFCLLISLFVFENYALTGGMEEDQAWLDNKLTSVFKSAFYGEETVKTFLKKELQLHSKPITPRVFHALNNCAHVFSRPFKRDHSIYDDPDIVGGRRLHMRYLPVGYFPKVPELPRKLVLKILDALKELGHRGYVLVESGTMYREGVHWDRTGVMPKDAFTKLELEGHNLTGSEAVYKFQGRAYLMYGDFAEALRFLDFTDSYDATTRSWSPKHKEGSLEAVMITKTNDLIEGYENDDLYFRGGSYIRVKVSDNIKPILAEAATKDPDQRRSFVEGRIQETVTGLAARFMKD